MKIKIGNKIYNSDNEPIMLIMTPKEKKHLNKNFIEIKEAKKFCIYPDTKHWNDNDYKKIKEWMEI